MCDADRRGQRARFLELLAKAPAANSRSYSCSTLIARRELGGSVAWVRWRAWMLVFSSAEMTQSSSLSGRPSHAFVEVEDTASLGLEIRIAREHPASVVPGLDRIFGQPAPDRRFPDRGHDPPSNDFSLQFRGAEARQGDAPFVGKLTGQRLDRDDDVGGKAPRRPCRGASSSPSRRSRKNASAIPT